MIMYQPETVVDTLVLVILNQPETDSSDINFKNTV